MTYFECTRKPVSLTGRSKAKDGLSCLGFARIADVARIAQCAFSDATSSMHSVKSKQQVVNIIQGVKHPEDVNA